MYNQPFEIRFDDQYINSEIAKDVVKIKKEILNNLDIQNRSFRLNDLGIIDYYYNLANLISNDTFLVNNMINYIPEFKKIVGNRNLDFYLSLNFGDSSIYQDRQGGELGIYYDGVLYDVIGDPSDVYINNVVIYRENLIFVDNSTLENPDAYVDAIQKRLDGFYGKKVVTVQKSNTLYDQLVEEISNDNLNLTPEEVNDIALDTIDSLYDPYYSLGIYNLMDYVVNIRIKGKDYKFIVAKTEINKLPNPEKLKQIDYFSNLMVTSNANGIPLDAKLSVDEINEKDSRYKKVSNKNKDLKIYKLYDIELFSNNANKKIEELEDGTFKIYIPMKAEYKNKNIQVYYIDEIGNRVLHETKEEDGYLVFETTHFSEYAVAGPKINNPQTGDNIIINLFIGIISLLGTIISIILLLRKNK